MKCLILFLLACPVWCIAQFDQGNIYLSGQATYSYQENGKVDKYKIKNLLLSPSIGLFVRHRLIVGGELGLMSVKEEGNNVGGYSDIETVSTTYTAGPFVRYFLNPGLFLQFSYFWGKMKEDVTAVSGNSVVIENHEDWKVQGYSLTPGYSVFLGQEKRVAIDIMAGYRFYSLNNSVEYKGFVAGLGVSAFLQREEDND